MNERYLTYNDLMQRLGICRSSVQRRVNDGSLPKPVKIGYLSRFRETEVNEALERLSAQRQK